jgi:hypothetical protein
MMDFLINPVVSHHGKGIHSDCEKEEWLLENDTTD